MVRTGTRHTDQTVAPRTQFPSPLPIDEHLVDIARVLSDAHAVVVEAEPGAGKTTRIPYHLLSEPWCSERVLVSEPRRIAARLAATRVAQERGHRLGQEVGYRVRFDDQTSEKTRLVYLTEGLLLRQLLDPGGFAGVDALILDEVHERSLDLDVLLALVKRALDDGARFKLILMSATVDADTLAKHFGAEVIRSKGRSFPIEIDHEPKEDSRPLPVRIRSAVRSILGREGDTLVFLPGAAEIRAAEKALEGVKEVEVALLHGDLPLDMQARVMAVGTGKRVVLSTNVAESSVTIPGVTTVIDSGLARTAVYDPWSGVTRLETRPISRARCIQRAGRAGRVAPGRALRLYTKGSFEARPPQDAPEILRSDLSAVLLSLLSVGLDPRTLRWVDPPSDKDWDQAELLLSKLGALRGTATSVVGRTMAHLPLPVRLARVVVAGAQLGIPKEACDAAALLAERDVFVRRRFGDGPGDVTAGDSDLAERMDALDQLREARFSRTLARDLGVDVGTARQVDRVSRAVESSLARACADLPTISADEGRLTRALLTGFMDRVAQRKKGRELVLENGTQATLDESSCVVASPLLLALSADAPGGRLRKASVRIACRLEADWLLDVLAEQIEALDELVFDRDRERVDQVSRLVYGKLTLDESRMAAPPGEACAELLVAAAIDKGPRAFDPEGTLERLFVRLQLLCRHFPKLVAQVSDDLQLMRKWGAWDETGPNELGLSRAALGAAASTRNSLSQLREASLVDELLHALPPSLQDALRKELPPETVLKGGRRLEIHYDKGREPWIESRLQDFFGMTEGPTICAGKVPLQIHFLAPNQRAIQVTTDLAGFWERHYPDLRKQLMRRYPKHLWPEDGRTAQPPRPGRIR